jgi:hypothetical protein
VPAQIAAELLTGRPWHHHVRHHEADSLGALFIDLQGSSGVLGGQNLEARMP